MKNMSKKTDWGSVPIDTKIYIKLSEKDAWERGHFAGFENGRVLVFQGGRTSWTTNKVTEWKYAKLSNEDN